MSKIKNGRLGAYGTEPFEQQQFGTAGVEGVKTVSRSSVYVIISENTARVTDDETNRKNGRIM